MGVKSYSPLLDLPKGNLIEDTPSDYMHQSCEGVMKTCASHWKNVYLSAADIRDLDDRIARIKMPNEVLRAARSFNEAIVQLIVN